MKNISWISCILFIKILSVTAVCKKDECPFSCGFKRYTNSTSDGTDYFCAKLFLKKETWDFSNTFCRLHFSSLTYKIGFNSTLHREWNDAELPKDELLWVGIRRIAYFFVVNSTGRLYREKTDKSAPKFWGDRWFSDEKRKYDCVALNVSTGDLVTRDCNLRFYYMCDDRDVPPEKLPEKLPEEPSCPDGTWELSYYLFGTGRKCISTFTPQPGRDAVETCEKYESRLATAYEYDILFSGNSSLFNSTTAYWVYIENYETCASKTFQVVNGSSENCFKSLPFTCVKELGTRDVEVWISPSNFRPFPSTSRCASNPDLFKCNVKIDRKQQFGKETKLMYQWYKDDIPINQNTYGFNMRFIAEPLKRDPLNTFNTSIVVARQGFYHCEVRIAGSWRSYLSEKIGFFYSDIATFIINVKGLVPYDFRDYSEDDFSGYMKHTTSTYFDSERVKNILSHFNTEWDFQSIRVHDNIATLKILLYIYRSDNKSDEDTYQEIKLAFNYTTVDNFSSTGTNRIISFSVSSADVCFTKESENDVCKGNIRWPTSIQTVSVNTESICIDKSKRLVPRQCKASVSTKAEWSEFNCSSCHHIQPRVKDLDINCSEGYTKFTNMNLCFKIYYEKETWHDAYRICSEKSNYMLNEVYDIDKGFFKTPLDRFWLSYMYSHGKIQRIGMKPQNNKFKYSLNIPKPDYHCLAAALLNKDYTPVLQKCNKKLSFVCVQDPFEVMSSARLSNTWNKLSVQDHRNCYYFAKDGDYSWQEAEDKCQLMEPKSDFVRTIFKTKPYRYFKMLIHQLFKKPECQSTLWWINLTYDGKMVDFLEADAEYLDWDPYTNFNLKEAYGAITLFPNEEIYWTLQKPTTKYKYICEIQDCDDDRPTQAYIENRSEESYNTSTGTPYYHFSLKCIPSGWFLTRSISWYKDGILLNISSDHLSFTNDSYPSSSLQELSKYQGYYWCSVDQLKPRQTTFSSKVLFKYSGIHTYVLSMKSQNQIYLEACAKSMLSEISFHDEEDMTLTKRFNKILDGLNVFHLAVRNLTCNSSHVDITVHVYSNIMDEEGILKHIQGANFTWLAKEWLVDLESISARSTVACYEEKTLLENGSLTWPKTNIGENAKPEKLCLKDDGGRVQRKCLGDFNTGAVWAPISITECSNSVSRVTKQLYDILNSEVSFSSSEKLESITSSPDKLVSGDVEIIADILKNFSRQPSLEHQILNPIVLTINNLFGVSQNVQRETGNSFNKIMNSFEGIASAVDIRNKSIQIAAPNLAVSVQPINLTSSIIPNCVFLQDWSSNLTTLFSITPEDFQNSIKNSTAGIVIPPLLVTKFGNISDRLIYQIRKNFNNVINFTVVSAVIQALFKNVTEYDISPPVKMAFKLDEEFKHANRTSIKCVFWDERLNNSLGGWSYKGCLLKRWNDDVIECSCNHLTSFAIILEMDSKPISKSDADVLSYITYVGCSLSCFGLGAIILTFMCFRQWRKSIKNKALFNLSACLLSFMILFMVGINKTDSYKLCFAISITLHYLLLACFGWMLVSAFIMYLNLVKVFNTYIPRLMQKAMLFAYGVPALIVIIIASSKYELYVDKFCWLSKKAFFYGIAAPVLTILLINFIFFGLILYANTCGKSKIYLHSNQDARKQNITRAKAMFYTSVLLGLSWIFGFLAVDRAKLVFQYLFAITTTLQGFLFFLFFIVKQKSASDMWHKVIFPTSITEKSNISHISASASYSNRIIQDSESSNNEHQNVIFKTS